MSNYDDDELGDLLYFILKKLGIKNETAVAVIILFCNRLKDIEENENEI